MSAVLMGLSILVGLFELAGLSRATAGVGRVIRGLPARDIARFVPSGRAPKARDGSARWHDTETIGTGAES
jgi:hypothetical protein